jgi:hypothetical protein
MIAPLAIYTSCMEHNTTIGCRSLFAARNLVYHLQATTANSGELETIERTRTLRCRSPRKRGTQYSAGSWVTGSPAFAGDDTVVIPIPNERNPPLARPAIALNEAFRPLQPQLQHVRSRT